MNNDNKFAPEAANITGLLSDRDHINAGVVPFGVRCLDDCLGGIYPRDILLLAAGTGVGKSGLAVQIATTAASQGKKTYGFFLEAFKGEVSYRMYYQELAGLARDRAMDFSGWIRGEWKHYDERYGEQVQANLAGKMSNLFTLYKNKEFTPWDLKMRLDDIASTADLVVLDHLHVVDSYKHEDENSAQTKTIKVLMDMALNHDIPVVVVSHMKKKQAHNYASVMESIADIHGSSNIQKMSTQLVIISRDWDAVTPPHLSSTFIKVEKDRKGRASSNVCRVDYDRSTNRYQQEYQVGRIKYDKDAKKQVWQPLDSHQYPNWASKPAPEPMF